MLEQAPLLQACDLPSLDVDPVTKYHVGAREQCMPKLAEKKKYPNSSSYTQRRVQDQFN